MWCPSHNFYTHKYIKLLHTMNFLGEKWRFSIKYKILFFENIYHYFKQTLLTENYTDITC